MKKLVIVLILGFSFCAHAADPKGAAPAKPVEVIMATTDDGRRVILLPDGRWNFVQAPAAQVPAPSSAPSCRDKIWADLISFFSGWEMDQVNKDSYMLQTKWKNTPNAAIMTGYRVRVTVIVNPDCTLKIDAAYQSYDEYTGWSDDPMEGIVKMSSLPGLGFDAKKVVEFDKKLKDDLNAIAAKNK